MAIHGRHIKAESIEHIRLLLAELQKRKIPVICSESFVKANAHQLQLDQQPKYPDQLTREMADCVFSLGGDGTLLDSILHVRDCGIPILGINTGRLGFLATTAKDTIPDALDKLFAGHYSLEERTLVQMEDPDHIFGRCSFALNEFAILRKETSSMITIKCYMNGEYLNTYWADGLMVSTPTGSTGYSLSCGGPIVMPETRTFVLTPVSPHNLNIRPLVIPEDTQLTFEVETRDARVLVSLDSRSKSVAPGSRMKVRKADFTVSLVKLEGSSFVETLRNKLGWGFDRRN